VGRAWIREDPCSSDPLCMLGSLTVVFGFGFFLSFFFFLFPLAHPVDFLPRLGFSIDFIPHFAGMHFQGFGGVGRRFDGRLTSPVFCVLQMHPGRRSRKGESWTKF